MTIQPKNIIFASIAIGAITILFGQIIGMVLTPQEAYAPSGRRGMWNAEAQQSPVLANQNPYASPYMIVYCDDPTTLQNAYEDWKAS